MPLDQDQLDRWMSFVADPRGTEIVWDDGLAGMAEYAEANLLGLEMSAALASVRAQIAFCGESAEEHEVLLDELRAAADAG